MSRALPASVPAGIFQYNNSLAPHVLKTGVNMCLPQKLECKTVLKRIRAADL